MAKRPQKPDRGLTDDATLALYDTISDRLRVGDKPGAVGAALEAVRSGAVSVDQLYRDVLAPLLVGTGDGWQRGELHVWQEHLASGAVRTIIEALYEHVQQARASWPPHGRVVVLACPPDESHDLGLRMLADHLEMAGWTAYFLGPDTPVTEIVEAARHVKADLVCLSASTHFHRVGLRDVYDTLRSQLPGVTVAVGGPPSARERRGGGGGGAAPAAGAAGGPPPPPTRSSTSSVCSKRAATRRPDEAMLSLRVAARFLRKSRLQSLLIVLGIAVGIAVQVFVGSLIVSLQQTLVDETIGSDAQVTVSGREGQRITYSDQLEKKMRADSEVETVVPVRTLSAIYRGAGVTAPLGVVGGALEGLDTIYDISPRMVLGEARLAAGDVLVGREFADANGVEPGDSIVLVVPDGRALRLVVSGVFDLGSAIANERTAFVAPETAADALRLKPDEYTDVQEQLDDPFTSQQVADRLRADPAFAALEVTEWQDQNQDLLSALQAQSSSSYMIQTFVLIAVALGIASTLAISAVQKTRQIGILKAMGMGDGCAALVFVWQAVALGVVGAGLGVAVGLGLIAAFNAARGAADGSFPITPETPFIAVSFAVGVAVALLSAIVPSRRTSRVDPIEVIQGA